MLWEDGKRGGSPVEDHEPLHIPEEKLVVVPGEVKVTPVPAEGKPHNRAGAISRGGVGILECLGRIRGNESVLRPLVN